jgi:hypothetical protein
MLIAATALGLVSCYLMSIRGAFAGDEGAAVAADCGLPEGNTIFCGRHRRYQDGDAFKSHRTENQTVHYVK